MQHCQPMPPLRPGHGPSNPRDWPRLWLEQEEPAEVAKLEELKKKQKAIEKELAEKRKQQLQQVDSAKTH